METQRKAWAHFYRETDRIFRPLLVLYHLLQERIKACGKDYIVRRVLKKRWRRDRPGKGGGFQNVGSHMEGCLILRVGRHKGAVTHVAWMEQRGSEVCHRKSQTGNSRDPSCICLLREEAAAQTHGVGDRKPVEGFEAGKNTGRTVGIPFFRG